jgi:hypothetical protein
MHHPIQSPPLRPRKNHTRPLLTPSKLPSTAPGDDYIDFSLRTQPPQNAVPRRPQKSAMRRRQRRRPARCLYRRHTPTPRPDLPPDPTRRIIPEITPTRLRPVPDFEDEAVLFFDADHDGDLDLLVGPGGNAHPPFSRQMQNRLFKNDGKGHFTLDADAFSANPTA